MAPGSGGGNAEFVEQAWDAASDLVADRADIYDAPACGIVVLPIQVPHAGNDQASIAAPMLRLFVGPHLWRRVM